MTRDPERDKTNALRLAAHGAHRPGLAARSRDNAIRFAADEGASFVELAEATGLSCAALERIVGRAPGPPGGAQGR